ncbi:MAG: hypothetical protein F2621_05535 [Actinobacteria bacterium]|uniref:Unannotated protein n=1 Tax=freshwater metagenome TaxID=449393 RepID=A0A6J6KMQ5_9ZZZZ|nr:hypothetical protein [Actinomycetota bacterium]
MSRCFRTLISVVALTAGFVLLPPPTPAHATETWDSIGSPIPGESAGANSGWSVATNQDGSIIAIGAPQISPTGNGMVQVYQLSSGAWSQLGADIVSSSADYTGYALALSSDGLTLAVGSPRADPGSINNAGEVRVYSLQSGTWVQIGATFTGAATSDGAGTAVALSATGNRLAFGASRAPSGIGPGQVSVFDYSAGTNSWTQVGATLTGEANNDEFGNSLSLSDDGAWLAVGAPKNDVGGAAANAGHARVFELVSTTWTTRGADIDGEVAGDLAGQSVALGTSGGRLVIGSHSSDVAGANAGRARVFDYTGTTWTQVGGAINGAAGDALGWAVDINATGDQIALGAPESDVPGSTAGSVTAFTLSSGTWTQRGTTITGTSSGDQAGYALAMSASGDRIVVGSPKRAVPSTNTGEVRVFGLSAASAASDATGSGIPGIYLQIAGPVGRSVQDSPVYFGGDRIAPLSTYTLSINPHGGRAFTLATGTTDARGNLESRMTLPALAPGDYVITFAGRHASGAGLKLANTIRVGAGGNYLVIGENRPGVW